MPQVHPVREVFDLTDSDRNIIFNMSVEDARARVADGDAMRIREIDGHFAFVARQNHVVRMARSLQLPMRYFIVKRADGPALVVAERIDTIRNWLDEHHYGDQFHPTYTRMAPAHYITEIALVGCPDPNPTYRRFFSPRRESLPADRDEIGRRYVGAVADSIGKWLDRVPNDAPIGVCFSGGVDSGAVFLVLYHLLQTSGQNLGRLKAFTLSVNGGGDDLEQSRRFLEALGLQMFHEPIEVPDDYIDPQETIRVMEDYKPLDVQAGTMSLAICRGIRERYANWRYLIDGDGGDENLKDYPIEENPELTIRSVLNNPMLYHEGWGVASIKHSLTYSGGLSRACTRNFAPASKFGFESFSPFTLPDVVEVSEGIPFIELTEWSNNKLYALKGEIVARGVKEITGLDMPVFAKRRFQHGAIGRSEFADRFPQDPGAYRRSLSAVFDA